MEFRYQTVAVALSLASVAAVLELIRRRRMQDVLWLPWLFIAITPAVVGLWIRPWVELSRWLGILYEPLVVVVIACGLAFAMLLYLTVVVSSLMRKNLRLAQEVALLRHDLEAMSRTRTTPES